MLLALDQAAENVEPVARERRTLLDVGRQIEGSNHGSDFFEGTWRAKQSEPSLWKVDRPAPQQAYLRFEPTDTGYLLMAYGVVNGGACAERPQVIIADGRRRPCST